MPTVLGSPRRAGELQPQRRSSLGSVDGPGPRSDDQPRAWRASGGSEGGKPYPVSLKASATRHTRDMPRLTPGQRYWMTGLRDQPGFDRIFVPSAHTALSCVRHGWTEYRLGADGKGQWVLTAEGVAALMILAMKPRRRRRSPKAVIV